jgi:hypothetical protein
MIVKEHVMPSKKRVFSKKKRLILEIVDVKYVGGYRLEITFQDGKRHQIDFEPFLRKAKNPDIRDFLDPGKFRSYRIEYGDLVWGDMELCFPIMDLYTGQIN